MRALPLFVAALLLTGVAAADNIRGDSIVCHAVARDATRYAAEVRDARAVPWNEFVPFLESSMLEAMGGPGVYIQDKSDVALLLETYKAMWASKKEPMDIYNTIMAACVAKKKKLF